MPATGRTISGDVAGRNGAVGLTPDLEVDARSMWEPGLPAMAVCQAPRIVADVPPSRASPAPTGGGGVFKALDLSGKNPVSHGTIHS